MKPIGIVDALEDQDLFGGLPVFRDLSSWGPWLAFLRAVYGSKMSDEAQERDLLKHPAIANAGEAGTRISQ